jgi:xanthine dehydrogenase accessory factor
MKELREIAEAWATHQRRGGKAALATVVQVEGSAYRRPGARLLVLPDGKTIGSISGGCLETDVIAHAEAVTKNGHPALISYDTQSEEDIIFGFGLGCQGIVHVFIEPLTKPNDGALAHTNALVMGGMRGVLATITRADEDNATLGSRLLLGDNGQGQGNAALLLAAQSALASRRSECRTIPWKHGTADVFVEYLHPPQPLVIFGAGHDAQPLAQLANMMGWRVSVADHRAAFATSRRFPTADAVFLTLHPSIPVEMKLTREMAAVLMTHNYRHDLALLRKLLDSPVNYIGILGPRRRTERLLLECQEVIPPLSPASLSRIYGPVGLNIGAQTPEQIALAIIAEIAAVTSGRSGGFLQDQDGPIYADPN